jgi:hypothetical protein
MKNTRLNLKFLDAMAKLPQNARMTANLIMVVDGEEVTVPVAVESLSWRSENREARSVTMTGIILDPVSS